MRRAMMVLMALATMGCAPEVECSEIGLLAVCYDGEERYVAECWPETFDPEAAWCTYPDGCPMQIGCADGQPRECPDGWTEHCGPRD